MNNKKIGVLIIDDSALIRSLMTGIINAAGDMETLGTAGDPLVAREMIRSLNPDVLTLDIEMPKMDGLDFLERLMRLRPMPVVMVSTLTARGAEITLRALELGAVDFIAKPKVGISNGMNAVAEEIREKIRAAALARVDRKKTPATNSIQRGSSAQPYAAPPLVKPAKSTQAVLAASSSEKIVAIGASTGGTDAIREILVKLPADFPGIVIAQHMPSGFTNSFATRLNGLCHITVKEATDGERVLAGHAYIAPGGKHLTVSKSGANYLLTVADGEPVNRHKPSVDVLFQSVAQNVGPNACGVILTGMGKDGARGLAVMRERGAYNFAQDESSSIVFGMPREAIALGAVHDVLPVTQMADQLMSHLTMVGHQVR